LIFSRDPSITNQHVSRGSLRVENSQTNRIPHIDLQHVFRTPGTACIPGVARIQAACADRVVFAHLEVLQSWSLSEIYRWKADNKPWSLFPMKFTRACQARSVGFSNNNRDQSRYGLYGSIPLYKSPLHIDWLTCPRWSDLLHVSHPDLRCQPVVRAISVVGYASYA
jgi:hypothetical protein